MDTWTCEFFDKVEVGFVNGTFDVLHPGHIWLLHYAKSRCKVLHVGIDSDERVRELKGPGRPFFSLIDRMHMLHSVKYVDNVIHFGSDEDLASCTKWLQPDIMVVGSDWKGKKVIGSENAKELVFFDRVGDYSTTKILQGITDR